MKFDFILKIAYIHIDTLFIHAKKEKMSNLLYFVAVILVIGWALGFFVFHTGGIIHVLLIIALIAIILRLIRGGSL